MASQAQMLASYDMDVHVNHAVFVSPTTLLVCGSRHPRPEHRTEAPPVAMSEIQILLVPVDILDESGPMDDRDLELIHGSSVFGSILGAVSTASDEFCLLVDSQLQLWRFDVQGWIHFWNSSFCLNQAIHQPSAPRFLREEMCT